MAAFGGACWNQLVAAINQNEESRRRNSAPQAGPLSRLTLTTFFSLRVAAAKTPPAMASAQTAAKRRGFTPPSQFCPRRITLVHFSPPSPPHSTTHCGNPRPSQFPSPPPHSAPFRMHPPFSFELPTILTHAAPQRQKHPPPPHGWDIFEKEPFESEGGEGEEANLRLSNWRRAMRPSGLTLVDFRWAKKEGFWDSESRSWVSEAGGREGYFRWRLRARRGGGGADNAN
jgi:hypothetical protein